MCHSMGLPLLSNDLLVCYGPVPVVLVQYRQVALLVEGWCPMRHSMGLPLLSNDLLVCYGPVPVVLHVSVLMVAYGPKHVKGK
jgi:hypothetical protein